MSVYNPYSLEGKTILITGASSGIGRSTAIECSKLGARLVITGRNESRLTETMKTLEGGGHSMIVADLSIDSEVELLVNQLQELDGVVFAAGVSNTKLIVMIKKTEIEHTFSANIFSAIMLTELLLKKKRIKKNGSLVFISSLASHNPDVANSIYAATKAAISSFSRSCAKELSGKQIRSNAVVPAMVNTPLVENLGFAEEDLERDKQKYPLKRYGQPEEIAWAIIYLLSDASAWVTGSELVIDGGLTLK